MLNFLASTPDRAVVYKTSGLDNWGRQHVEEDFSFLCRVALNEKRETISVTTGEDVIYSATLSANGLVLLREGALVEFTDFEGNAHRKKIIDKSFKRDLGGNVIMTKVVV